MRNKSKILGVGSYLPPDIFKNEDLTHMMDTSNEWIVQRTGIQQRHWVDAQTSTSDLALEASLKALDSAQLKPNDLDMILLATLSPDHEFPGTGCFLQAKMGVQNIPAIDVRQQCSGFIYALSMADHFIQGGQYKKILVVGAETQTKGLDKTTKGRDIAVLFGDGAGAVVLGEAITESDKDPHILSTHLHADGRFAKELWTPAPGFAFQETRLSRSMMDEDLHFPKMNGKQVFVNAVKKMPEAIMESLKANELSIEDVDLFVLHQANSRINETIASLLKIDPEKVYNTIERFGNTTAATIPIGLDEAVKEGKLKKGMLVSLAAFGSGFTWSSALVRW